MLGASHYSEHLYVLFHSHPIANYEVGGIIIFISLMMKLRYRVK